MHENNLYRIYFLIHDVSVWYAIMREARIQFGNNWRSQPRIKKKLLRQKWQPTNQTVWFEVPNPAFASWVGIKLGVVPKADAGK
jgi:hypothetical protein